MLDSAFWIPSLPWLPWKLSVENPMRKKLFVIWHDAVGGLPSDFWILWSGILVNRIGAMALPFLSFFLGGLLLGDRRIDRHLLWRMEC